MHGINTLILSSDDINDIRMFLAIFKGFNLFYQIDKDKFDNLSEKLLDLNAALNFDNITKVVYKDGAILVKCKYIP